MSTEPIIRHACSRPLPDRVQLRVVAVVSRGGGTSFSGGMSGGLGGMDVGPGNAAAYEHRLAEVEKKLQTLIDEVKALRQERRPENPPAKR